MKNQDSSKFHVTESNKLEGLTQTFKLIAFSKGKNPFAKRFVLVPSTAFKTFLKMDLAKDRAISFGLNLFTYEEGLVHLAHLFLENEARRIPTLLELTMRIQTELISLIEKPPKDEQIYEPLKRYLGEKFTFISAHIEKKLYFLSKNLARLFLNYGRFTQVEFQGPDENFQAFLFKKIFKESSDWITRIDTLSPIIKENLTSQDIEIFVFAPFMTKEEVDFLKKISASAQVEIFFLTPTAYLLEDQLSDREEARMEKKKGILPNLEKNAFLANYSLLFREMQKNIIDSTDSVSNIYLVESFAEGFEEWNARLQNDHFLIGTAKPTLLKALQTDLTLMRIPEEQILIEEENLSIECHVAETRYREIEILHNQLLALMADSQKSALPLRPIDIQVFAKDITVFEPYITAVFGKKESSLKYALQGEKSYPYPLVQAFQTLLELSQNKFEAKVVASLLEYPAFRKKWQFAASDIQTIRSYIDEEAFTWGENLEQKNAYYREKGFEKGSYDHLTIGTKENFETRLIERFILGNKKKSIGSHTSAIDIKDADIIACFLKLLNSLSDDLKQISSALKHPLHVWSEILKGLLNSYFVTEHLKEEDRAGLEYLEEKIASLSIDDSIVRETPCHFITAFQVLKDSLKKGGSRLKEEDLNAIRFSSLLPHHAMPGRVIALIGLEEGVFPI